MIDYLEIGPVPYDESCEQVGTRSYNPTKARKECEIFRGQLRRKFGPEPFGASLVIHSNPHDFGTYYEVAVKYNDEIEEAVNYALDIEAKCPGNWDSESLLALEKITNPFLRWSEHE